MFSETDWPIGQSLCDPRTFNPIPVLALRQGFQEILFLSGGRPHQELERFGVHKFISPNHTSGNWNEWKGFSSQYYNNNFKL